MHSPIAIRLKPDVVLPPRSVVIISPDGLDPTRFWQLIEQDRLPNIRRVFVDGGVTVDPTVNGLPSVTYANYASLITGRLPGHHDIVNNLWFDRATLVSQDYMTLATYLNVNRHLRAPTLYEMLHDQFTLNIQCHTRRGVTHTIDNRARFSAAWIMGLYTLADHHVPEDMEEAADLANKVKRWPNVIMTYYPAVDEIGHRYGPDSEEYAKAIEQIDLAVKRIYDALDRAHLTDITYFVLITDHGMSPLRTDRSMDLLTWLRQKRGLKVLSAPLSHKDYSKSHTDYSKRFQEIESYDAFVAVGADRCAQIHLRGQRGWPYGPTAEEIEDFVRADPSLLSLATVDCVLTHPATDRVQVQSSRGSAVIERRENDGVKQYRLVLQQGDPIGYTGDGTLREFVAQGWHDSRAWLRATSRSERPDFVPQVMEMFDSPRAGDLVLFAAEHTNFSKHYNGGHGSCLQRDMRIVWQVAGPDLPHGAVVHNARLVDVAPTILGLLGEAQQLEHYPAIDGIDLSEALRRAQPHPKDALLAPSAH